MEEDFKQVINEYLEDCDRLGIKAEKPFKGSFNVRIPANLHQKAALQAMESQVALNSFVAEAIRSMVIEKS